MNHSKSIKDIETVKRTDFEEIDQFDPKRFTLNKAKRISLLMLILKSKMVSKKLKQ